MKIPRKVLILAGTFIVIGVVGLGIYLQRHDPEYTKSFKDRDTGEIVSYQPNKTPEQQAAESLIVLGSASLFDNGATQDQYQIAKTALTEYASSNLKNRYLSVTLIPASISGKAGKIKGKLRLGQTDILLDIQIQLRDLYQARVVISDPTGQYGGYDSGFRPSSRNG